MKRFCENIYLEMTQPTEEDSRSDRQRLLDGLSALGYNNAHMPLIALQGLHGACLAGEYRVTATLVCREQGWEIVSVESGDTRAQHYGLAADYGSTTIVMQLVDMNSGEIVAQASEPNGQGIYGSDILTRITYTLQSEDHMEDMQRATVESINRLLDRLT